MHQDLQINRLRALVAVVDHGGFRRAADALFVTQPAISQQIRHLSTLIREPVFTSTSRNLELSGAGEELLGYARRMVSLNDEVVARYNPPADDGTRLDIGVCDQFVQLLPSILSMVTEALPKAKVSLKVDTSEGLLHDIVSDRVDMALTLDASDLERPAPTGGVFELGEAQLGWFGEPAALPGIGQAPPREDDVVPLALSTEPCQLRGRIVDALDADDISWRVAYEGSDLAGLRAAMKAGIGVGCLLDNSDAVWGLPRTSSHSLPTPDAVPVSLRVASGTTATRSNTKVIRATMHRALTGYPVAA